MASVLAGCAEPGDGTAPAGPVAAAPQRVVDGEPLHGNLSVAVSPLPAELAPVVSPDRPMNCFALATDTGEKTYLGGAVLDLVWTPTVGATAELTVTASNGPASTWRATGTSPLRLHIVPEEDAPLSLPLDVRLEPANGPMELGASQDVEVAVQVGLLESLVDGLAAQQARCS